MSEAFWQRKDEVPISVWHTNRRWVAPLCNQRNNSVTLSRYSNCRKRDSFTLLGTRRKIERFQFCYSHVFFSEMRFRIFWKSILNESLLHMWKGRWGSFWSPLMSKWVMRYCFSHKRAWPSFLTRHLYIKLRNCFRASISNYYREVRSISS